MRSSSWPVARTGGEKEVDRHDRLRRTSTFRNGALDRWQSSRVGVVGGGLLGGPAALQVVRSGASVVIFDPARGRPENLGSQLVQAGRFKVESLCETCDAIAPGQARGMTVDVRHAGVGVLAELDILLDCSDDPNLAMDLTTISNGLGVPLLRLAVDGTGEREFGRVLASHGGDGHACQLCPYSPRDLAGRFARQPCPGLPAPAAAPTLAGGAIGMVVVGLGILQAQRLLGGNDRGRVLDREVFIDLDGMEILPLQLSPSARCISKHIRWRLRALERSAADTTLEELFQLVGRVLGASPETSDLVLEPHLHPLCLAAFCDCGSAEQAVGTVWAAPPDCPDCGRPMHWRRDLKWRRLAWRHSEELGIGRRSLVQLGFPDRGAMVTARRGGDCVRVVLD